MRLNNSEDTASKLVVSILDMESFFGFILSDSMIFNSFFNYTFICKKLVSELRRFGTTGLRIGIIHLPVRCMIPFRTLSSLSPRPIIKFEETRFLPTKEMTGRQPH